MVSFIVITALSVNEFIVTPWAVSVQGEKSRVDVGEDGVVYCNMDGVCGMAKIVERNISQSGMIGDVRR